MAQTIGIVGGGQLGRMLTLAALPLGFKVIVIESDNNCPAAQAGAQVILGDINDERAIKQLGMRSDFLTIEIEHVNSAALESLASMGKSVNPAPATIRLIQDKLSQKQFLKAENIPTAPYSPITTKSDAIQIWHEYNEKMLIKTRHGAYDGRGNMLIRSANDIDSAFQTFKNRKLYAEKFIPFKKELAVMVAKSTHGDVRTYPVVETIHKRNICLEVLAPAPVSNNIRRAAENIARQTISLFDGAGMFGVELFLTPDNQILVNEIAPRVHNSGHYTLDACQTTQFEQHIRAVTGLPLGTTNMDVPAAVMINILGDRNGPTHLAGLDEALDIPHTNLHMYGKSPTKVDRKMGHITASGTSLAQARNRARNARKRLSV